MITPAYSPTATERVLPRLALDFTTGVLDPRVSVTRALNTATRINSSGLVEIVNANLPRFDYDPVTLQPRGLLIEETRINYVLYSEDFTQASWGKLTSGVGVPPVVTPNYETAPNGTNTATRLQLNAGANGINDYSLLRQSPVSPGGTVSRSIWAKSNTGSNQVVALVATNSATKITITPTWQRLVLPNSAAGPQQFDISVGGAALTPATADISIWGAQHEVGAFATSYIPTTTTSLTRNADVVSMTGTNFSSWYNASAGTFVTSASAISTGANRVIIGGGVLVYPNYIRSNNQGGSFDSANLAATANVVTTDVFKLATTYGSSAQQACLNGGTVANGAYNNAFASLTSIGIGNAAGGAFLNGHVRTVNYYPQRLLSAELQAFSK